MKKAKKSMPKGMMNKFEQGPMDNDKGVKEGSKADIKRDKNEMGSTKPKKKK